MERKKPSRNQNRSLSKQQELFVQALLKGKSQRQAYYEAYPKSKGWKDNAVDCCASKLFKNDKVRQRFDELDKKIKDKQETRVIYSTSQLREFWTKVLRDESSGMTNRLKASELLGKSQGMFVEKRESTIKSENMVIEVAKRDKD